MYFANRALKQMGNSSTKVYKYILNVCVHVCVAGVDTIVQYGSAQFVMCLMYMYKCMCMCSDVC